ncbi:hypothetical protein ABZX51_006265 [Aspergillus tubingensis]|uniref:Similar to An11g04080 n=1 Tax=Aspergillus niger TaxID=5061 RepID=A0A100IJB6_ASPNG|nr:ubiquitin carboxyl-terminal hydrolase family protein [Aspergillus tubingensis]GAQ42274.1 similar to An11g04080 [Aspergillus niger]GFN16913.1 ubiquitin carboxyl-terminal hydrolase family protein [Aspergillus tubingensis]GLA62218.1 hypothetical protein AtubIFM54640_002761 [Aspergillus tubingensis]GLA92300.1 hypothetical protein AtubIFM57143_007818 [Aspergillus tubingensis]
MPIVVPEINYVPSTLLHSTSHLKIEYLELCGTKPEATPDYIPGTNLQLLTNIWTLKIQTKNDPDTNTGAISLILDLSPLGHSSPCRMHVTITDEPRGPAYADERQIMKRVRLHEVEYTVGGLCNLIVANDLDRYNYTSDRFYLHNRHWFKKLIEELGGNQRIKEQEVRDAQNAVSFVWKGPGTDPNNHVDIAVGATMVRGTIDRREREDLGF